MLKIIIKATKLIAGDNNQKKEVHFFINSKNCNISDSLRVSKVRKPGSLSLIMRSLEWLRRKTKTSGDLTDDLRGDLTYRELFLT